MSQKSLWSYTYNHSGYTITFNGTNVGGAGTLKPAKKTAGNLASNKESGAITLRECADRHKVHPFDPTKFKNIWEWKKSIRAAIAS